MPSKKSITKKAVKKAAATPELTMDVTLRVDQERDEEFYRWETDGIIYSEMLGSPDCPAAFRMAFKTIFIDHLLTKCETTNPRCITTFFPLVMLCLQDNAPVESRAIAAALRTLREELAPGLTEKILAQLNGDGLTL